MILGGGKLSLTDKVKYVLSIYSIHLEAFGDSESRIFEELAHNVGLGIEYKKTQEAYQVSVLEKEQQTAKLHKSLQNTISTLGAMLEHRDLYTSGHQRRVADFAMALAEKYGLEKERTSWLYLAATVHDIGKIAIPSSILSKPAALSVAEFALVKTHPEVGFQILKGIDFPGPIAEIVRQHHEYLDGSGYPLGLKENEILLESKILTVADITESMSSHRPYRPAFTKEYVINELKQMRKTKLDPIVVDICIKLLEENAYQFPDLDPINKPELLQSTDVSRSQRER